MRAKTVLSVATAVLLSLIAQSRLECFAFKSGYMDEKVHRNIIETAFQQEDVPSKYIELIVRGADSQDDVTSKKFTASPHHHFDDCMIRESMAYYKERLAKAVQNSRHAYKALGSGQQLSSVSDTFLTFGEGLHTIQDFYSHSNYVEMLVRDGNKDELVDWNALPPGLKTGYFYWNGYTDNESTRSRAVSVSSLTESYKKQGRTLTFQTDAAWKGRLKNPSVAACLAYVLDPRFQCLHKELNKDDAKQDEGKVKLPDGTTLHAKARALAIKETKRQWQAFQEELSKKYGKRAQLILPALKGYDAPTINLKVRVPTKAGESEEIPVDCGIALKPSASEKNNIRQNPARYDLTIRATVFNENNKVEFKAENEIRGARCGSTGGVTFQIPPRTGSGRRMVVIKAMFAGDERFNSVKEVRELQIGEESLVNSKWLIETDFGGNRKYAVTVLNDTPSAFSVRVMGHRSGDTPAVFNGIRNGSNIKLKGWRLVDEKKVVVVKQTDDGLNQIDSVVVGKKKQTFDVSATLDAEAKVVRGTFNKSSKFVGKRL